MESFNPQNNKENEKNESYERHNSFIEQALKAIGYSGMAAGGALALASLYELITKEKTGHLLLDHFSDKLPHFVYRALEHWDALPLYLKAVSGIGIFSSGHQIAETLKEGQDDDEA